MYRNLLVCVLAFGFGLAGWAQAADITSNLEAYWTFDEGSGQTANDSSGNENHATLGADTGTANDPVWMAADWSDWGGNALYFDGGTYLVTPPLLDVGTGELTVSFFVYQTEMTDWQYVLSNKGNFSDNFIRIGFSKDDGRLRFYTEEDNNVHVSPVTDEAYTGEWFHVVVTRSGAEGKAYVDGALVFEFATQAGDIGNGGSPWYIGQSGSDQGSFIGYLDEMRVYSRALEEGDVAALWAGLTTGSYDYAMIDEPDDGTEDVAPQQVTLSWAPGDTAVTHDVYVGTSLEDVNNATPASPEYKGNQANLSLVLEDLKLETTYYWRIDEVNNAMAGSPWKGQVWSFTTEAVAYPMATGVITATASSVDSDAIDPNATINGAGLDADGLHDDEGDDMWLCGADDAEPWIRYDFDQTYKLHEMRVWNHNSESETLLGHGIKEARIEVSVDGETWTEVHASYAFNQAPGAIGYAVNTVVPMNDALARSVRITALSNWSAYPEIFTQKGLSEVQFDYIPVWAREFEPASGATDVAPDLTLSWRAGREAAEHDVYIGLSADAMTLAGTVTDTTFDTSGAGLLLGQTYYWQVVEVNEAEAATAWAGPINTFSTEAVRMIDDFESYGNETPNRIFQAWQDGYGYSADEYFSVGYAGNGTGAALGHDIWTSGGEHYEGDIMESGIRYEGSHSVPFYFDGLSEMTLVFDEAWDFTAFGAAGLAVHFWGDPDNTATSLYVKINNSKIPYDGDAADLRYPGWTTWYIALADQAGVPLTNVTSLTIGVESGQGVLYVDDVFLTPAAPEPTEPKASGSSTILIGDGSNRVLKYQVDGLTWTYDSVFAEGEYDGAGLESPMGMCQDSQGRIYVGEQTAGGRVLRFDADGNYIDTMATDGVGEYVGRAEAVVLGPDGNVYVADAFGNADQIYKIDVSSKQTSIFIPKLYDGVNALNNPRGISFGPSGNCFITGRQNNAVLEFDGTNGSFIDTFVEANTPQDLLWVDGKLLVVYSGSGGGIVRYNADGSFDKQVLNAGLTGSPFLFTLATVNGQVYAVGYAGNGIYRVESPGMITKVTPDDGLGALHSPRRILVLK